DLGVARGVDVEAEVAEEAQDGAVRVRLHRVAQREPEGVREGERRARRGLERRAVVDVARRAEALAHQGRLGRGEEHGPQRGIRGLAKFVRDRGLVGAEPLRVETDAGVKTIRTLLNGTGRVARVTVDMGRPVWDGRRIPVAADGEVVDRPLDVEGRRYAVTCVAMGNPHCVVFVDDDLADLALADLGPRFARHPFFPRGVNTEFVRPLGPERLEIRVWEL